MLLRRLSPLLSGFTRHDRSAWSVLRRWRVTASIRALDDIPDAPKPMPAAKTVPKDLRIDFAEEEVLSYSSELLEQVRYNERQYSDCVLLTKVGGFWELYFEQADEVGPLLGLRVAQRRSRSSGGSNDSASSVSMSGFPLYQLERYLRILVQDLGRKVALAEQFPSTDSRNEFTRRVTRVITAGTLVDERLLDPLQHNYLAAVLPGKTPADPAAVAWCELATGELFTMEVDADALPGLLARLAPHEVLLDVEEGKEGAKETGSWSAGLLHHQRAFIAFEPLAQRAAELGWAPWAHLFDTTVAPSAEGFSPRERSACASLLEYISTRLIDTHAGLQPPRRELQSAIVRMDRSTLRALEICTNMRDGGVRGTLLSAVRRTVTKSGARALADSLAAPLTDMKAIQLRHDLVQALVTDGGLRKNLRLLLRRTADLPRLLQRFAMARASGDDMLALASTIEALHDVQTLLGEHAEPVVRAAVAEEIHAASAPRAIATRIRNAVDEISLLRQHRMEEVAMAEALAAAADADPFMSMTQSAKQAVQRLADKTSPSRATRRKQVPPAEVWVMKSTASEVLTDLHARLKAAYAEQEDLLERLTEFYGPGAQISLRSRPGLGHYVHLRAKAARSVHELASSIDDSAIVGSSKHTRSFTHPDWTILGARIVQLVHQIRTQEALTFERIRELVVSRLGVLRRGAAMLDHLDIAASHAELAVEQSLVRPEMTMEPVHLVEAGRHPIVEAATAVAASGNTSTGPGGPGQFVPNDCWLGREEPGERVWLVTGPNMGGKSTFLRQNAIISVLAQAGAFVPANGARLGVVDAIFTRVGAGDNLYGNESTFMVEMVETAQILRHATPRSLVIMDEVGRGTTTADGMALAYACLHHLHYINKSRTLFATHFHELSVLTAGFAHSACYCTGLRELEDGSFYFVHRLEPGVSRFSHGLKVAQLAGLPAEALQVAKEVHGDLVRRFDTLRA